MNTPGTSSTESLLKRQNSMDWWYFGPVLLAIVMFLLMGTIFERRIELFWQRIIEHRQAQLAQRTENQEARSISVPATTSLHTVKTPSQRTLASGKAGNASCEYNIQQLEAKG